MLGEVRITSRLAIFSTSIYAQHVLLTFLWNNLPFGAWVFSGMLYFCSRETIFSCLINDSLSWNATGNWPRYSQRPFGHSVMYSPMWSPESLSRILASVNGSSSLVVHRSGHKQCSPLNSCHMRYSSHVSSITCLPPFTGLASSLSLHDSQYKKKMYQENGFNLKSRGSNDKIIWEFLIWSSRTFQYDGMAVDNELLGIWNKD